MRWKRCLGNNSCACLCWRWLRSVTRRINDFFILIDGIDFIDDGTATICRIAIDAQVTVEDLGKLNLEPFCPCYGLLCSVPEIGNSLR